MAESKSPDPPGPLTDSPWFWFFVFGAMALVALLVIGPKHFRRQERLVRMHEARESSDAYRAGNELTQPEDDLDAGSRATVSMLAAFLLLVLLTAGSVWMIRRRRHSTARATGPNSEGERR